MSGNKKTGSDNVPSVVFEFFKFLGFSIWFLIVGLTTISLKNKFRLIDLGLAILVSIGLGYCDYFFSWWPSNFQTSYGEIFFWIKSKIGVVYYVPYFIFHTAYYGYQKRRTILRLKNGLDVLKGSDHTQKYPRVLSIIKINEFKTKLYVESPTLGIDDFKQKQDRLESAFNQTIEKIVRTDEPRFFEIYLTTKKLPTNVHYEDLKSSCEKPCEFILGESQSGLITYDIRKLPHMLIAGTSGYGKSNFFKQTLMTLLENTNHIQMHLLDLKGGIEMNDFKDLPNINIATTMDGALGVLERVKKEMDDRFVYLTNKGHNNLIPERDKKDRIVIAVDEASVLYMKRYTDSSDGKTALKARQVTDEISKLGRAAAIHLILATQKVTKDTIDTHIRENLSGRVSFKANDMEASRTVLGNSMAVDLPEVKGRGIFHVGSKFIEFQAPIITKEYIKKSIENIKIEFGLGVRDILQPELITNVIYASPIKKPNKFDSES